MKKDIDTIISFLRQTFEDHKKTSAVVAVSGGIDSAVSLTLATKALSPENVYPILLPYGSQGMSDAVAVCDYNNIPHENRHEQNIKNTVDSLCELLKISENERVRKGNIMARIRMILLFDLAKEKNALVVGTENKSEYYLGYFTRFGDEASDIEPISHLFKTQVRETAQFLNIPQEILTKKPSAGLWVGQTDEEELGFSYEEADKVLSTMAEKKKENLKETSVSAQKILDRVRSQSFKHQTPYRVEG